MLIKCYNTIIFNIDAESLIGLFFARKRFLELMIYNKVDNVIHTMIDTDIPISFGHNVLLFAILKLNQLNII